MRTLKNKTKRFNDMRRRRGHGNKTRRKEKTHARKTHARKTHARKTHARKGKTRRKGTRRKGKCTRKTRARGLCSSKEEVPTLSVIQQRLNEQKKRMKNINDDNEKHIKTVDDISAFLAQRNKAIRDYKTESKARKETFLRQRDDIEMRRKESIAAHTERRKRYNRSKTKSVN